MDHKGIDYHEVLVSPTDEVVEFKQLESLLKIINQNKCFGNSYETSKLTGALCIEGFIVSIVTDEGQRQPKVLMHCWNKLGENYFDVTKNYVWEGFQLEGEYHYYPVQEFFCDEYQPIDGKKINMLSNAEEVAIELNGDLVVFLNSKK